MVGMVLKMRWILSHQHPPLCLSDGVFTHIKIIYTNLNQKKKSLDPFLDKSGRKDLKTCMEFFAQEKTTDGFSELFNLSEIILSRTGDKYLTRILGECIRELKDPHEKIREYVFLLLHVFHILPDYMRRGNSIRG